MRYALRDLPALLRTPGGRLQFRFLALRRLWPLLAPIARLHRRFALRRTHVVVVVGSFGKTTTVRATAAALGLATDPRPQANAYSGLALNILRTRASDRFGVYEAGIDGIGQMRANSRMLLPRTVIVTGIGSEHHRSLGNLGVTRDEKADMLRGLDEDGLAVLNGDDPNVLWMKSQTRARVLTFGRKMHNDVVIAEAKLDWPTGTRLRLRIRNEEQDFDVRLVGTPMHYAIAAAVTTAWAAGIPLPHVAKRLAALAPTPGRLEPVPLESGAWLLRDDFKGAIETVERALDTLDEIPAGRKLIVMGEISEPPGSQGPVYRRIGERMAEVAARIVLVGTSYQPYAAGARRGGLAAHDVIGAGRSPAAAAAEIRAMLAPGDVVLIKGRDTQRLERVAMHLQGETVGCDIPHCDTRTRCVQCPMRERGWRGRRVVI